MTRTVKTVSADNVILIGMPASGKSTIGVLLAKAMGCDYIDTDLLIQLQEGCRLEETIRQKGIDAFLDIEGEVCAGLDTANTVIATGGSAVYRDRAMRHLKELGTVVYLKTDLDEILRRITDVLGRGVALREGQTLADLYAERTVLYERYADLIVDEKDLSMDETAAAVLSALENS